MQESTGQQDRSSMLSQSLEFIQCVHILLGDMQHGTINLLRKATPEHVQEAAIFPGSWTGKQPVLQPIARKEFPY